MKSRFTTLFALLMVLTLVLSACATTPAATPDAAAHTDAVAPADTQERLKPGQVEIRDSNGNPVGSTRVTLPA